MEKLEISMPNLWGFIYINGDGEECVIKIFGAMSPGSSQSRLQPRTSEKEQNSRGLLKDFCLVKFEQFKKKKGRVFQQKQETK